MPRVRQRVPANRQHRPGDHRLDTCACVASSFDYVVEDAGLPNGISYVRIRGGLPEKLRFFQPSIRRSRASASIEGTALKTDVTRRVCRSSRSESRCRSTTSPPGPATSSRTASSATTASPARRTPTSTSTPGGTSSARSSSRSTCPRCCGPSWRGRRGSASTSRSGRTPTRTSGSRARYRLMPGIWEALPGRGTPCSVLTKSPLLLRDIDLMRELAERAGFSANLSVPTLDEKAWRATEPHTPHPRARLEAVAELNRAGIPTGVLIAPLMPGDQRRARAGRADPRACDRGGRDAHRRRSRCTCAARCASVFFDWLREHRPDLVPRYEQLYRRGAYAQPDGARAPGATGRAGHGAARPRGAGRLSPPRAGARSGARDARGERSRGLAAAGPLRATRPSSRRCSDLPRLGT